MQLPEPRRLLRILATALAGFALHTACAGTKVGDAFPDLAGFTLEGKLPDELKGKVVMVDFWASWCGPCADSFPAMSELAEKYAAKGLVVIAVNEDEKRADMEQFLERHKARFTVVRDGGRDGKKLVDKVGIAVMPTSFLLDRAGKVRFLHAGYHGAETKGKYAQEIERLLEEEPK
jgi:thiol-disulfide isomerase/thioredoxin